MLVFWRLVIWGIVALFRRLGDGRSEPDRADLERILAERFARGEIDQDEYTRRRHVLQADR